MAIRVRTIRAVYRNMLGTIVCYTYSTVWCCCGVDAYIADTDSTALDDAHRLSTITACAIQAQPECRKAGDCTVNTGAGCLVGTIRYSEHVLCCVRATTYPRSKQTGNSVYITSAASL